MTCCARTDTSRSTSRPPLKAAIGVSSASGSISICIPRGGRPLVSANFTPASRSLCTASIERSVCPPPARRSSSLTRRLQPCTADFATRAPKSAIRSLRATRALDLGRVGRTQAPCSRAREAVSISLFTVPFSPTCHKLAPNPAVLGVQRRTVLLLGDPRRPVGHLLEPRVRRVVAVREPGRPVGLRLDALHLVSSLLRFVTQWMSTVTSSAGSAVNSSHVYERASSSAPWIENVHSSPAACGGVGPADRTGKPRS
jgi:hypothetical protein